MSDIRNQTSDNKLDITGLGCTGKFILAIWRPHANSYVCNLSSFALLKNTTIETVETVKLRHRHVIFMVCTLIEHSS